MNFLEAFQLAIDIEMANQPNLNVFGQGVWHHAYHGHTLDNLPEKYGKDRVRDCPIAESAITGMACGYALSGGRSLVMHPQIDFSLYAMDAFINTIAKWRYVLGQDIDLPITIHFFIHRGEGRGAQHSQSLQSWFAHVPGLKIFYASEAKDSYNALRWSLNSSNPVVLFTDFGLLQHKATGLSPTILKASEITEPVITQENDGGILTLVTYGIMHSRVKAILKKKGLLKLVNLINLTVLNLCDHQLIVNSVMQTNNLLIIEDTWSFCSIGDGIIARVVKALPNTPLKVDGINLPFTFAPTAKVLEDAYYISDQAIIDKIKTFL